MLYYHHTDFFMTHRLKDKLSNNVLGDNDLQWLLPYDSSFPWETILNFNNLMKRFLGTLVEICFQKEELNINLL